MEAAFTHWSISWPVLAGYLVVAAAHLAGMRRRPAAAAEPGGAAEEAAPRAAPAREAVVFQAGLLVVTLALVSPLGYWSDVYLWIRAVQLLLVAIVGPGLLVLGAPWSALARSWRPRSWPLRVRGTSAAGRPGHVPFPVSRPVAAIVVSNAVWAGWQLPALVDLARADSGVALAEHACYVAAGLLFWLQLISSRPVRVPTPPLRRLSLLIGTVGMFTVLGMVLVFGSGVVYPGYANAAHHTMTVLDDQQLSGAVLWMGSLLPFVVGGVALMMAWLSDEESAELTDGLDRLLAPRKNGWPSRPVIR